MSSDSLLIVLWLVGGTVLAWVLLTRFRVWLDRRVASLDEAPRAPAEDERSNDLVRLWGLAVAAGGVAFAFFGAGWAVLGVIPLQLFGAFAVALGAWMLTFPAKYRQLRRRSRH